MYQYSFDETRAGDWRLSRAKYEQLHECYKLILKRIEEWNQLAVTHGALEAPYKAEALDFERMIEWGEQELRDKNPREVVVKGISIGSLRYAKAALIYGARVRKAEAQSAAKPDWPTAVRAAMQDIGKPLVEVAEKISYPPAEILSEVAPPESRVVGVSAPEWDAFISHASEDKADFVERLAQELRSRNLNIWYDNFTLTVGDSLRGSIDRGLAHSKYGVVIPSSSFFAKEWPQKELDGLVAREVDGRKVILPVWHNIDAAGIRTYSPILADRVAISSSRGVHAVANAIIAGMGLAGNPARTSSGNSGGPSNISPSSIAGPPAEPETGPIAVYGHVESCEQRARGRFNVLHSVFALPGTHRPNPHFTPLPEVEAALHAFRSGEVLVLHGLGGVGKTQHAVQYAHEQRDRYSQILWASAESEQTLRDALAALAELPELALPVETGFASVEKKVRALRRWFEGTENWLLILDNADSPEAARAIERRLLPSAHRGHVIITARVAEWTSAFRLQYTDAWDNAQSVTFLSKRIAERSPAPEDLARLARALGGLPLALEHAAAYICETRISVDEYLRLFESDRDTLLARHYRGMTDYRASVVTTWHVTIRRLSFLSRYALHLAACLSPDPIPRRLFDYILANASADYTHEFIELGFLRRALAAPNAINVSLGELARYSLVALSEHSLRVHPLLQAVVRDSARLRPWNYYYRIWRLLYGISDKKAWKIALWPKRAAHLLSSDGVMPDRHSDVTVVQMRPYVPHIEAVLSHLPEELFRNFAFRPRLVGMLEHHREYSDAVTALRSILAPAAEHSAHLRVETDWLFAHFDDLYQRAAEIEDRTSITFRLLRDQDSEGRLSWTYDFLRSLSRGLAKAGDTTAARRLFQLCFDHATEADASHVESAHTRIDEAFALVACTPVEETRRLLEEGITLFEQHKGMAPYGNVIEAVSVYATVAETPVQRTRAVGWLQQLLPPAQQLLRHGLPHACYAAAQLARLLKDSGQMDEALAICEETLRIAVRSRKLRRLRAEHLAPLWEQRGSALGELGRSLAAARSYTRCLALERRHNKPTPLRIVGLLNDVGEMFRRAGCLEIAESRLLEAAALLEKEWAENPHFAEILASLLGVALGRVKRRSEGENVLRRSIASRFARLGPEHTELALPHRLLGVFLHEAARFPEAETELRHALVLSEKDAQPDNPSLLPALDSVASLLEDLQRQAEAFPLRQRYLAIAERNKE